MSRHRSEQTLVVAQGFMTDDAILDLLRTRAANATVCSDGVPNVHPVATPAAIEAAERELDVEFPTLLRRLYLEIGNGGRVLGPGYGILGLPGGYDNYGDWNVVKTTREMVQDYRWWDGSIVICDWGCTMMSCIDCSDGDFPVFRFDGNFVGDSMHDDEPPDDAWDVESDSFAEWLSTYLNASTT